MKQSREKKIGPGAAGARRKSGRRILYVLPFAPRLDASHGGSRAIAELIYHMSFRNSVAVLYLQAKHEPPIDERVKAACALAEAVERPVAGGPDGTPWRHHWRIWLSLLRGRPVWATEWAVAAFAQRLRRLVVTWRPAVLQVEFHIMAQYLAAIRDIDIPRVLTVHEPGAAAMRERQAAAQLRGQIVPLLDLWAWQRYEKSIASAVDALVVFTERDRETLAPAAGSTPIVVIPLGMTVPERPLDPAGTAPASLLFVGNFMHPPNIDAAQRLAQTLFPRLQRRYPDLRLYLAGANPPPELLALNGDRITVTGYVPDVRPYLDRAAIVVAPLRFGGGMRVKVLEALAAGKAMVASPLAVEGLAVRDGQQVVLAQSDDEFCDAIDRLLADPRQRCRLAANGYAWAQAHLGWQKPVDAYEQLYRCLIEGAK